MFKHLATHSPGLIVASSATAGAQQALGARVENFRMAQGRIVEHGSVAA